MIRQFYNNIEISADIMFLNNVLFLISISEYIYYETMGVVDNLACLWLESEIKKILRSYTVRGFRIVIIAVDS